MKTLKLNHRKIRYTDQGNGKCVVLLHGFTESSGMWIKFIRKFTTKFRVIAIDLPGFGKSDCLAEVHSMELMADVVHKILHHCNVNRCILVGHSMGGYVALMVLKKYPGLVKGITLFHSSPFADTPEGKENRDRMVALIKQGKMNYLSRFIKSLFPEEVQEKFSGKIQQLIGEAQEISTKALVAAMIGMKEREDSSSLLAQATIPVLLIHGMKDSRIPVERISEMISLAPHTETLVLRDVGHMGFLEAPKETFQVIWHFAGRCFQSM